MFIRSDRCLGRDRADSSRRGSRTGLLHAHRLAGVALAAAAMTSSAVAQSIDTTGQWNGVTSIDPWGVPPGVTPTYGETITATSTQDRLTSFTFELARESGTAPQYQAFVYQFNTATNTIVGPAGVICPLDVLPRRLPHDIENTLAALAANPPVNLNPPGVSLKVAA